MGQAMLQRWLYEGRVPARCDVIKPSPLPDSLHASDIHWHTSLASYNSDTPPALVILAVKPQQMTEILPEIFARFGNTPCYVSIAAGMRLSRYREYLGETARLVRAMPNTPVRLGAGVTTLATDSALQTSEHALITSLCDALGLTLWLDDESQLDTATALAGSGPAYVFLFMDALAEAATKHGLPSDAADKLARQTVLGAAELATERNDMSLSALKEEVTSKGGTTEAALAQLQRTDGLRELVDDAIQAAIARAQSLA
jgi:pyrroline-5-carboxylate reductase